MKAVVDVGASSGTGSNLSGVQSGRVNRKKDIENEEIQMYLSKLKDLVPFMPKNKKLSKLEVIQYVIDYICDLQYALETHPSVNNLNAAELTARLQGENGSIVTTVPAVPTGAQRQPLGVLAPSPNTIISNVSSNSLSPIPAEHTSLQSKENKAIVFASLLIFGRGPLTDVSGGGCVGGEKVRSFPGNVNKNGAWEHPRAPSLPTSNSRLLHRCHLYTWKKSKRLIVGQFHVKNVARIRLTRNRMSFIKESSLLEFFGGTRSGGGGKEAF